MRIPDELKGAFRVRAADSDKYTVGVVVVVGGSPQYANAPVIAGLGARAGGAGLVRLVVPSESRFCAGALIPEATFMELAPGCEMPRADVAVVGMGLGQGDEQENLVGRLLSGSEGRFVVDADALTILAHLQAAGIWRKPSAGQEIILTPHEGEAARLLGVTHEEVSADRLAAARKIASSYGVTVVLKGRGTLVVSFDGERVYTNTTGNPFMALGGMGDLLAGVIAARWAYLRGDPFIAAAGAVWMHGEASDEIVASAGDPSIVNTAAHIGSLRARLDG